MAGAHFWRRGQEEKVGPAEFEGHTYGESTWLDHLRSACKADRHIYLELVGAPHIVRIMAAQAVRWTRRRPAARRAQDALGRRRAAWSRKPFTPSCVISAKLTFFRNATLLYKKDSYLDLRGDQSFDICRTRTACGLRSPHPLRTLPLVEPRGNVEL